jgi:hypothetical protein
MYGSVSLRHRAKPSVIFALRNAGSCDPARVDRIHAEARRQHLFDAGAVEERDVGLGPAAGGLRPIRRNSTSAA